MQAAVAAERAKKGAPSLRLPAIEMIKGFDIWQQNPKVDLPLFAGGHGKLLSDVSYNHW